MLVYYSLPGFLAPSLVSPHWVSLMLLFPIHNSVLFLEGPRVFLCIPHIHATRSQALTFGQHLSPLCAVWNSSSLSAPPPPNTWALHWQHWWLLAHPSSCKSECHPGLLPPFTHCFWRSSISQSAPDFSGCDSLSPSHLPYAGLWQFSPGFLHLSPDGFPIFIFTVLPTPKSFSHCSEGDNYKMQFRLCESPA